MILKRHSKAGRAYPTNAAGMLSKAGATYLFSVNSILREALEEGARCAGDDIGASSFVLSHPGPPHEHGPVRGDPGWLCKEGDPFSWGLTYCDKRSSGAKALGPCELNSYPREISNPKGCEISDSNTTSP
jgi:hypothetical protein